MKLKLQSPVIFRDLGEFGSFFRWYVRSRGYRLLTKFEVVKDVLVDALYKKRGRYARPILHLGTIGLVFLVITLGPLILNQSEENAQSEDLKGILATQAYGTSFYTQQAEEVRQYRGGEIITHIVAEGETLSDIAMRYGLSVETILWENNLTAKVVLKPGQEIRILPVDGVRHKVKRGETIYTIGKRYGLEESQVQAVVDYPFNEFANDETFELAAGQYLMIPGGVMPNAVEPVKPKLAQFTPDAGVVAAVGSFVWPASGKITQGYSFYHKAIDIANRSGGSILAADGGTVISAGWPDSSGYGNRVIIDHGNGFVTLYGHLSLVQVVDGQRVNRGDVIGQMGSTGRSTGTHLHFEVRRGQGSGSFLNPLSYLQ